MRLLVETLLVLALGVAVGLAVNAADADGLDLGRDHFPQGPLDGRVAPAGGPAEATPARSASGQQPTPPPADGADGEEAPAASPAPPGPDERIAARLAAKGLVGIGFEEAAAAWRDELRELGAFLFVDARDDDAYAAGHIPGAWQLDPYRPDRYIADLVPLLPGTVKIIVYCAGGECEDSESAALLLQQLGADPDALQVYTGGMTAWRENDMPVELGPRDSGQLAEGASP